MLNSEDPLDETARADRHGCQWRDHLQLGALVGVKPRREP